MFHGPIREAVPFFESLGFRCPERKDHASFLQEVTTPKGKPRNIPGTLEQQAWAYVYMSWCLLHCEAS